MPTRPPSGTSPQKPRPLTHKRDLVLIAALLLLAAALWFFGFATRDSGEAGLFAVVSVEGRIERVLPLDMQEESLSLAPLRPVRFERRGAAIRFIEVDCPDHLCEQMGWQKNAGDVAVCLPNKTVLEIMDKKALEARGESTT